MTWTNDYGQPVGDRTDWTGPAGLPAPAHTGRFVELRPLTGTDAGAVHDTLGPHPELWTYQPDEPPASVTAAAAGIAALTTQPDIVGYAIVDVASGRFAGRVVYLRIQPRIGSIEVGAIIYAPWFQRTRAATELQYLLLRHAFELGYRRYEWKCDSLNAPSRRAATRLGFTDEGTWRNALIVKGRNRDTTWYSITDTEWPTVRAALETWLDDANVDDRGRQRRSLAEIRASGPGRNGG